MKTSVFEKIASTLLLGAVLIVAANAWLAFHAEQVLADSEFWVAHTWEVIAGLEHLLGLVKDAETGARGFLITGDQQYLVSQNAAGLALPGQVEQLRFLVRDNPEQLQHLTELGDVARRRIALINDTVEVRRTQGAEAAFAVVREGSGIAEMDHVRVITALMQEAERKLLTKRLDDSGRARTEARVAVAFASTLDILFIVVTIWSLGYERRLRQKASETAGKLEKLQAISDVGLTRLSLAELTSAMLDRLRRVAEIDAVALLAWHGTEVEVIAANGVDLAPGVRMPVFDDSPLAQSGNTNTEVKLNAAEIMRLRIPAFYKEGHAMCSILILPLSVSSRVTALVVAARRAPDAFTPQDEQLLSVVADRIALAIDRAELFEGESAARRQAEAAAAEVQLLNTQLEERVRQRTAELEATNQELEAFSYSVSHDLRAPLRSVDGFSVAIEEDYGELLTDEGKHYLQRIRAGVQRMGQLIDALLQLSRITRSELSVESVNLSALAGEVARELEQQNAPRELRFVIEPGLTTPGDPRLLRAVFENMLGNAVKFTANVASALIEFGYSPGRNAYYIRDNGAGFDQKYAHKLFVAFQRLHGDKDFKGSGIGLATVARVIRRHHGTMSAEGVLGEGATFWFTLNGGQ